MNAMNGFTNAQQIVPGTNARYAPRPLDWPDCYGFNPDQVLVLDKAVADAISAHRAHEGVPDAVRSWWRGSCHDSVQA
jgi:hypothetical protein